jgi:hypothetical protein
VWLAGAATKHERPIERGRIIGPHAWTCCHDREIVSPANSGRYRKFSRGCCRKPHLLGIELMPRIRSSQDQYLFRPGAGVRYAHIDSPVTALTDWDLIEAHLLDMLRVALSIRAGPCCRRLLYAGWQNPRQAEPPGS